MLKRVNAPKILKYDNSKFIFLAEKYIDNFTENYFNTCNTESSTSFCGKEQLSIINYWTFGTKQITETDSNYTYGISLPYSPKGMVGSVSLYSTRFFLISK